jgi:hypothetical protein
VEGIDSGGWRRKIKTLVAGLDPEVAVLFGREDATGHHPLRLTLGGCREILSLYDDQVLAFTTDEAVRGAVQQELTDTLTLLRLKVQILRLLQRAYPTRRVAIVGPLPCPGGEVGVEIRGGPGFPGKAARAQTYAEALHLLHQQVLKANTAPRP